MDMCCALASIDIPGDAAEGGAEISISIVRTVFTSTHAWRPERNRQQCMCGRMEFIWVIHATDVCLPQVSLSASK